VKNEMKNENEIEKGNIRKPNSRDGDLKIFVTRILFKESDDSGPDNSRFPNFEKSCYIRSRYGNRL